MIGSMLLVKTVQRAGRPLSIEALTPVILYGGEVAGRRFDPKSAAPPSANLSRKKPSWDYWLAGSEFFQFAGMKHQTEIVTDDVLCGTLERRAPRQSPSICLSSAPSSNT